MATHNLRTVMIPPYFLKFWDKRVVKVLAKLVKAITAKLKWRCDFTWGEVGRHGGHAGVGRLANIMDMRPFR
eukprot:2044759-Amphidinium_carterae.1